MSSQTKTNQTTLVFLGTQDIHEDAPRITPPKAVEKNGVVERGDQAFWAAHPPTETILLSRWMKPVRANRNFRFKGGRSVSTDTRTVNIPDLLMDPVVDPKSESVRMQRYNNSGEKVQYRFVCTEALIEEAPACLILTPEQHQDIASSQRKISRLHTDLRESED